MAQEKRKRDAVRKSPRKPTNTPLSKNQRIEYSGTSSPVSRSSPSSRSLQCQCDSQCTTETCLSVATFGNSERSTVRVEIPETQYPIMEPCIIPVIEAREPTSGTPPFNTKRNALEWLFETGAFSDMILRCGGEEFELHKAVVLPRCKVFCEAHKQWLSSTNTSTVDDDLFIETEATPSGRFTIVLREVTSDVERMIAFLYKTDCHEEAHDSSLEDMDEHILIQFGDFSMAHRYGIPGLKEQSLRMILLAASKALDLRTLDLLLRLKRKEDGMDREGRNIWGSLGSAISMVMEDSDVDVMH